MDNSNGSNNIIGEGSVLKGNLSSSGNVRLEGKVIGDILGLQGHAKENFLKWCENVWKGTMAFKDLLPLAPKTFIGPKGKYIKLDFRPIFGKSKKKLE